MPYDSLDATEDNLERDADLDLGPLECRVELDRDLTTPDNNARNKILSLLLLVVACSNYS